MLLHHWAEDDVEHGVFDVLLDKGTESGIIVFGKVDGCLVLVGFAERDYLRSARVHEGETNRVNPTLDRVERGVAGGIRSRQHGSSDTATAVVTHYDDVPDVQRPEAVRQDTDRVVVDGLELVRDIPLGEELTRWRGEDRALRNSRIAASQEQVLGMLSVLREVLQQVGVGGIRHGRTEVLVPVCQVHQVREPCCGIVEVHNVLVRAVPIILTIPGQDTSGRSGSRQGGDNDRRHNQENWSEELHKHDGKPDQLKMNVI